MGIRRAHGLVVFLALSAACGRAGGPIAITLESAGGTAVIQVSGLSSSERSALARAGLSEAQWNALMQVRVADAAADAPPVLGLFSVADEAIRFTPRFPFDPGRNYRVVFDPSKMFASREAPPVTAVLAVPPVVAAASTTVVRMLPTSERVPENLLRVYLEFSAPMSRENGRDHLRLLDDSGREVRDAFLALDIEFWSPDRRRYTIFFDPGRVKRGILPNDERGRALVTGRRYTIEVDPRWRDANGQPLAAPFRRTFGVSAADLSPIRLEDWRVRPSAAGTRGPLIVTFPKPLDHGLLQRALGVARAAGDVVMGEGAVGPDERAWQFTPRDSWAPGRYDLFVLSILEDPQGNRIGRPFDIDTFEHIDRSPQPDRLTVPFVVK